MGWIRSSLVVFQKHYMGLKVRQNSSQFGVFEGLFSQYIARQYLSAQLVQFLYNNGGKLLTIATIM